MRVKERRLGFAALLLVLAAGVLLFSSAYLLWALLIMAALAAIQALLVLADARAMALEVETAPGGQVGKPLRLTVTARRKGLFLAAGAVEIDLELRNVMFGSVHVRHLTVPLERGTARFVTDLTPELCGETTVRCTGAWARDQMSLFTVRCAPFREARTVCYPRPVDLELLLSRVTVGAANAGGLMQNRRGGDLSETFDIREYVPGDDVRTIHWKLSSKTDTLIVREPSEPSHYDVALLPDLGLTQEGAAVTADELNAAAALTVAAGQRLLEQGVTFCVVIPTKQGLWLREVRDRRGLRQLLPEWLGLELQPRAGTGLELFLAQRLDLQFTRLLLISAGKYARDLTALGRRIGVTAVSTAEGETAPSYLTFGADCETVVLPARQPKGLRYKIVC